MRQWLADWLAAFALILAVYLIGDGLDPLVNVSGLLEFVDAEEGCLALHDALQLP